MKSKLLFLLLAALGSSLAAAPQFAPKAISPRSVKFEKRSIPLIQNGKVNFQLYVPKKAPAAVQKAALEFASYLSEISGSKITPVNVLPADKNVTVLRYGDEKFAAEKKISLSALDRDGFVIAAFGNQILLAGNDVLKDGAGEGTIFAGFEFLERFAGVRFYFPGKLGTLVPRKKVWQVPAMKIYDRPDSQYRRIYWRSCVYGDRFQKWYEPVKNQAEAEESYRRHLRNSTMTLPNCHGLAYLGYVKRFVKTHPEYFALKADGQRADASLVRVPSDGHGHLCFSSGIMEEIYQDAKAVLTGPEAAAKRNIPASARWSHSKPFFNLMPNDSMARCRCAKCWPHFQGAETGSHYTDKAAAFLWKQLLTVPNRLKKEGIPGYVTMMAYDLCRNVPAYSIPDNVIMQVAQTGPWKEAKPEEQQKDEKRLQEWVKKTGSKIYLWSYPTKLAVRTVYDVANFTPRVIGEYYKRMHKYSFGTFLEAESDYWLFGHLNFYVFSKVMWDHTTDVTALLDEYRTRMFGKGAAPMKEIMEALEDIWLKQIFCNTVDTSVGPVAHAPSEHKLWTEIFSKKVIARIEGLFDKAEKLAGSDKASVDRIRLMRRELWGPTFRASETYFKKSAAVELWKSDVGLLKKGEKITIDGKGDEEAWKNAPQIALLPLGKSEAEVQTFIKLLADDENFYFLADCREPFTNEMRRDKRPFDHQDMWMDNALEFHLDTDGKRQNSYQIIVDSWGSVSDLYNTPGKLSNNWKWNSGTTAKTAIIPGKGWIAEVKIPRKNMTAVKGNTLVANFNRHRVVNGKKVHFFYTWSPHVSTFGNLANFGVLHLGKSVDKNLLTDGDFKVTGLKKAPGSKWLFWGPAPIRDEKVFRTAGVSMRLEGNRRQLIHKLDSLKSDTTYRFSFFVRQENVKLAPGAKSGGFYVRVDDGNGVVRYFPKQCYYGTIPWMRWEFTYRTSAKKLGKPYIHFVLRNCTGKAWVDHVELIEIPDQKKK